MAYTDAQIDLKIDTLDVKVTEANESSQDALDIVTDLQDTLEAEYANYIDIDYYSSHVNETFDVTNKVFKLNGMFHPLERIVDHEGYIYICFLNQLSTATYKYNVFRSTTSVSGAAIPKYYKFFGKYTNGNVPSWIDEAFLIETDGELENRLQNLENMGSDLEHQGQAITDLTIQVDNIESDLSTEVADRVQDISDLHDEIHLIRDNLTLRVVNQETVINNINKTVLSVTDGTNFAVTDSEGYVGLKYDEDGLDTNKFSTHFISKFKHDTGIDNLINVYDEIRSGLTEETDERINDVSDLHDEIHSVRDDLVNATSVQNTKINQYSSLITQYIELIQSLVDADGFHITDSEGYVALKYDEDGLDAALLSDHFKYLITQIEGIGLQLGETSDTAYAGNKGKKNAEDIQTINSNILSLVSDLATLENEIDGKASQAIVNAIQAELNHLKEIFAEIDDDSFSITDSEGNIGLKYDEDGLDTAILSEHFKELVKNIEGIGQDEATKKKINSLVSITYNLKEVNEDGFYLVDEDGYIGAYMDSDGSYGFGGGSSYTVVKEIDYA